MPTLEQVDELYSQRKELDKKWRDYNSSFVQPEPKLDESLADSKKDLGGVYGDFEILGRRPRTNHKCGNLVGLKGCLNVKGHDVVTLDGVNYRGMVYVKVVHRFCHNPRCEVCYKYGYAVREARNASDVIKEASKRHGEAFHIISSVPKSDYGLTFKQLCLKNRKILLSRGIIGGATVFHGFRFHRANETYAGETAHWFWSPHFHSLSFVSGGYGKCRECSKLGHVGKYSCAGCSGWEARTRKLNEKDGYIVKVADASSERKTIEGSLWYQLTHCSINVKQKRFHPLVYWGCCASRKLKVTHEKHEELCPVCHLKLQPIRYFGRHEIVTDFNSPLFKRSFWMDMDEGEGSVFAVNGQAGLG